MALSRLCGLQSVAFRNLFGRSSAIQRVLRVNSVRTVVYSESGAILKRPQRVSFGVLKVLVVVGASVVIGGTISKNGAEYLEKYEWFIPDEDDD